VKIGIVGLPNAGKSSLFNALTSAGVDAANYPFTTVEPNVAIVPVPDGRLDRVVDTIGSTPTVYETIEFHDIAGLVRGAHRGEGLGNRFLANIRETDALLHVVRTHDDPQVVHPEGRVDPLADVETIETELLYADLEQAERRLDKVAREAKSGDKDKVAEETWLRELVSALGEGRPARTVPAPAAAAMAMRNLEPLPPSRCSTSQRWARGSRSSRRRPFASMPRPRAHALPPPRPGSRRSSQSSMARMPARCATSWGCTSPGSPP